MIVQVIPIDDLREHEDSFDCFCEPTVHDEGEDDVGEPIRVIVHQSLDGRERHGRQN